MSGYADGLEVIMSGLTDILMILVAIAALFLILKIAFKLLKAVLIIGVIAFLMYYFGLFDKLF